MVVVRYAMANTGDSIIASSEMPSILLLEPGGAVHGASAAMSAALSTEPGASHKLVASLSSGATAQNVEVFEVSKNSFDRAKWMVGIGGNQVKVAMR